MTVEGWGTVAMDFDERVTARSVVDGVLPLRPGLPLGQATYFHRALRRFGGEHEFVVFPREGHVIQERRHQIDVLERTRAWFDRWLAGPAPTPGRKTRCPR
ncbi:prolyl oligopeptidase family serine peptidase [Nonomuraea fuscirosea]|uniref:prolyl oligopeptidase family serine peptidase n=1 Tax=Nonomuraea fuscirosea TaxID=1291556 RepID=UPI00342832EC